MEELTYKQRLLEEAWTDIIQSATSVWRLINNNISGRICTSRPEELTHEQQERLMKIESEKIRQLKKELAF